MLRGEQRNKPVRYLIFFIAFLLSMHKVQCLSGSRAYIDFIISFTGGLNRGKTDLYVGSVRYVLLMIS